MNLKNLILAVLAIVSIQLESQAQTSFSCTYREYCTWNEYTEKFGNCEGYEETSLFVVNDQETIIKHTIENMKSTYYVNSREYDSEYDVYTYDVTSDVGNNYYYVIDPKNKEIRLVYDQDGETMLLTFYVKAIF